MAYPITYTTNPKVSFTQQLSSTFPDYSRAIPTSSGVTDTVQFDNEPASPQFLYTYSQCVALYLSYLEIHPEWKTTPGRTLLRAMQHKPVAGKEYEVHKQYYSILSYIVNHLSWMRLRETEYMLAFGLLERFIEKERFDLSSSTAPMPILVSLIAANKISADNAYSNILYCQSLSISPAALHESEKNFLLSLQWNMFFTAEQLQDLVTICQYGVKLL